TRSKWSIIPSLPGIARRKRVLTAHSSGYRIESGRPNFFCGNTKELPMMNRLNRRAVLKSSAAGVAALAAGPLVGAALQGAEKKGSQMSYGLVTYMWGADWDLPTLLANCE